MWRSESSVPNGIDDSATLHRWFLKGLNIKDECAMALVNVDNLSPNNWCSHLRQRAVCTTETKFRTYLLHGAESFLRN